MKDYRNKGTGNLGVREKINLAETVRKTPPGAVKNMLRL